MKKNRKKFNLHDLAGQVEKMSFSEQKSSAGGDYYYDFEGRFLGQCGTGNQIRVMSHDAYLINNCYGESYLNDRCQAIIFIDAGPICQANIASSMLGLPVTIDYDPYNPKTQGSCTVDDKVISLNYYGYFIQDSNYWEILSTLQHERTHYYQNGLTYNEREYAAYYEQVNNPIFANCSYAFQQGTMEQYWKYYHRLYG